MQVDLTVAEMTAIHRAARYRQRKDMMFDEPCGGEDAALESVIRKMHPALCAAASAIKE